MENASSQLDMFTVHALDPPLRDNRDVMEYPFLSLQKRRIKPIEFKDMNVSISVAADTRFSIATIWDWDLMIFAASHLNEAIEDGHEPKPRIRFVPYDALRQIGRGTGGRDYKELAAAIKRLAATMIITDIRSDDQSNESGQAGFHWLAGFWIPMKYQFLSWMTVNNPDGEPDPSRPWEIELPPWLYNAILSRREILAVHSDYFKLTGGLERWLYRLARKAVPDKGEPPLFSFRMDTLHKRSGSSRPLKKFAFDIRKMAERQPLPEYDIIINRNGPHELVTLMRNRAKTGRLPRGLKLSFDHLTK